MLLLKIARRVAATPDDCRILHVGDNGDEAALEELGLDLWEATEDAEAVFKTEGIRVSREEEIVLAAVCGDKVVGAATVGHHVEEGEPVFTFSVAVDAAWQAKGLGRKLVEKAIEFAKSMGARQFRIWVVNPNMASLLESVGFEADHRGWSLDSPHMEMYV
jgi:GNAT superfamily N-acetyltransferase